MKQNRRIVTVAAGLACAGLIGTAVPASAASSSDSTSSPYQASQAFDVAAQQDVTDTSLAPQAIPAVVGTAFVTGAAAGAGKVVAGWAAKKVIGIWDVTSTLDASMLD